MKYYYKYPSPVGDMYIAEMDGAITDVLFREIPNTVERETEIIARAAAMLHEYFNGKRREFGGLPLAPRGTEFQQKAWSALLEIPYGETRSYKQQAIAIGNVKATRAVGAANGKNPISVIIPCHRVIGSDKSLTGYGGGMEIKKALLELEGCL